MGHSKSKGVALPIETIIILVLAVLVITVLTSFFFDVFGKEKGRAQNLQELLTGKCFEYAQLDSTCKPSLFSTSTRQRQIADELKSQYCDAPGERLCSGSTIDSCLQSCCKIYCG